MSVRLASFVPASRPLVRRRPALALALQGGGAHGAFTWGVIDSLLQSEAVDVVAASGASAGALNAAVLAHGLMVGGHAGARDALARFWRAVADSLPMAGEGPSFDGLPDGSRLHATPWLQSMLWWSRLLAPSEFNPAGIDPLRRIIEGQIDFEVLRRRSPIRLFIAATRVSDARLRVFREHELSADALLASACLPQLRHAVQLGGETYWDGGYSANPPLMPLLRDGGARDVMLVLLMAGPRPALPRSAREIESRVLEIGFQSAFLAELRVLDGLRASLPWWTLASPARELRRARWHAIDASPALGSLPIESRLVPQARFLTALEQLGRARAQDWLEAHGSRLGRQSTVRLAEWVG